MTIKVHAAMFAPNAARVLACLHEKELNYQFIPVNMLNGAHEQKQEPFISISPFGLVPALEDGDLKLFESRAINRYIAYAYAENGTQLVFDDPKKMAIVGVWLEVEAHQYDPPAAWLTRELCIKPLLGFAAADEAIVNEQIARLGKVLDVYETRLAQSKYLCGDTFTLADLHHLPTLDHLMKTRVKAVFDARARVSAWAADILARPAWQKVVAMRNNH